MKHALVVGGTGMLADVSLWLIDNGYHVSIIARNSARMDALINEAGSKSPVTSLLVNYTDEKKLQEKIENTINQNGNIDLIVAWIHSIAETALQIIAETVSQQQHNWKLFHVLGSSTDLEETKQKVHVPDNCQYHQVRLGFIIEKDRSRWLTNEEISSGVIEAIKQKKEILTVGVAEPWEMRP